MLKLAIAGRSTMFPDHDGDVSRIARRGWRSVVVSDECELLLNQPTGSGRRSLVL